MMERNFPRGIVILLAGLILWGLVGCDDFEYKGKPPVNPNASPEAKTLLSFLYEIEGNYILSGHHNYSSQPDRFTNGVEEMTGKRPVVWGSDFSFHFNGKEPDSMRQKMIDKAREMYHRGHIITLMWHNCFPSYGDTCESETIWIWKDIIEQDRWDSLTTAGTELNNQWRRQLDKVASFLKQLQDEHIPVLWRPYHEMNGIWFWWCNHPGEDGVIKLWRNMYDYFTNHHQLNNLLWVWNANAPRDKKDDEAYAYADYFPGLDYVDVLAADVYHLDYKQSHHDDLLQLAQGKPIALGEVGQLPTPEILDAQPRWTWFMGWANWLYKANEPDSVKALYNARRVITLDELKRDQQGRFTITLNN